MILGGYDYRGIAGMQGITDVAAEFVDEKLLRRIELDAMLMTVLLKQLRERFKTSLSSVWIGCTSPRCTPWKSPESSRLRSGCALGDEKRIQRFM